MVPEKRKGGSIHTQYYTMRKRINDASFNSPNLSFFDKHNNHDDSRHGYNFQDHVTSNHETRVGVSTFDDCFANNMGFEETIKSVTSISVVDKSPNIQFPEESKDSSFHSLHLSDGRIICSFNTEDPEIPCNDDIFLLIHPSTSFSYSVRPESATDYIDPSSSSSADENNHEQGLSGVVDPEPSFTWLQMACTNLSSEFDSAHPHAGYIFKSEPFDTKCLHALSQQPDITRNPGQSPFIHTNSVLNGDRVLTEDGLDSSAACSEMPLWTESMGSSSISDYNNSDNDGHLPDFSDIEALILKLDLEYAQESCITSEAIARHQYNPYKKTIISLEQTALSSLQRSMSSLGAFAIFHSRRFNYYIKKTEVTIGRSTDDTDVDIDLRKEGSANMISRRQATIKMETDGSFTLKNLGKNSISVNGNSIIHGQGASLSSSCLIEISGMSFMFEVNDSYVIQYLDNIIKKSQGKYTTFEWSPEGQP